MKKFYFFVSYVMTNPLGFSFGRAFLELSEKRISLETAESLLKKQPGNSNKEIVIVSYKKVKKKDFEINK